MDSYICIEILLFPVTNLTILRILISPPLFPHFWSRDGGFPCGSTGKIGITYILEYFDKHQLSNKSKLKNIFK